jgi:hypothetical protein
MSFDPSTLTSCSLNRFRHWGATEHHVLGMALVRTLPTSCAVGPGGVAANPIDRASCATIAVGVLQNHHKGVKFTLPVEKTSMKSDADRAFRER